MNNRNRRRLTLFLGLFFLFFGLCAEKGWAQKGKVFGIRPDEHGERRVIIGFKGPLADGMVMAYGGRILRTFRIVNAAAASLTAHEVFSLAEEDTVAFIEPDYRVRISGEVVPWGVDRIGAEHVHGEFTGEGVRVAIIDTGIDYQHPDLDGSYLGGHDFVNQDADPMDDHGHGTHVAGIVAAEADGEGVVGVAPGAGLYGLKVLGADGSGWVSDIIAAIDWAIENGADVISMSLGGPDYSRAFEEACDKAYASGLLLVAAAGNDGGGPVSYPAAYDAVMAVSAIDRTDRLAGFSNVGPEIELAAPGVDILSTLPGGQYAAWSGTSMATPHVSGVAALVKSANPSLSAGALRQRLQATAEDMGDPGRDEWFGYGLVDARGALSGNDEGQVTVHVDLQGREDESGALIRVDGYEETSPGDGTVSFHLPAGDHLVEVRMEGYLWAEKRFELQGGEDIDLVPVTLLGGDVNNDGTINIYDLTLVGSAYGTAPPEDPRADINGDGRVDVFDLTLVGGNYGKEGPSPWPDTAPGGWAFPVGDADSGAGWHVTNPLGNSWYSSTTNRWYRGHLGEDWAKTGDSAYGEPVYAAAAGEVVVVRPNCGNYLDVVVIEHLVDGIEEPVYSFYGHIEAEEFVQEGDRVEKRQQIGWIGDPGVFFPHLHFEIKNRTALVNPPFSNCTDLSRGWYVSAGYSGISDDYDGGDFYDPSDGVDGNRYYHPTRFIEAHR